MGDLSTCGSADYIVISHKVNTNWWRRWPRLSAKYPIWNRIWCRNVSLYCPIQYLFSKAHFLRLVPLEEETLASKFVWGQVLSENLARLAVNHFATKHYLTQQVLPAIDKDLKTLEEYASQFDDEKAQSFNDWMTAYKQVQNGLGTR